MTYKLVIFDFDGTLADSFSWFVGVFNDVADRFGLRKFSESELDELRGLGSRELLKRLGVAAWKLPLIARHMHALKARDLDLIRLFPGVEALLRRLRNAEIALAVVSSNSVDNVRRILGPQNAARIDYFACGVPLLGKTRSFREVLKKCGCGPQEALAIGDEIRDLEAARAAGIPFGAVSWGYAKPEALARLGPAEHFPTIEAIGDAVLG
jgi:phosphoglycolate phosphatase